jgi:transketolase
MTSIAVGLALAGKIPFTNSFAVFAAGRSYDQIRQGACISNLNVKIVGSSSGLSDFGDGATHQAIEDLAIMRAIPNLTVICPADANETVAATKAIADFHGPVYLRLNRNDYPNVTEEGALFEIGQPKVLREGSDIAVFATGITVGLALKAAENLKGRVSVKVINVATIKPINEEKIAELEKGCKGIVCTEEHSIVGGLGSAVAEAVRGTPKPMVFHGIKDEFGVSAPDYNTLLEHFNITAEGIEKAVLELEEYV